jgi:hypothetical protein
MRVFLDDHALSSPGDSIAAAIAAARTEAGRKGRVVVDVLVDGERLDEDALDAPSTRPAGDIELKCLSADPRRLVAESFTGVAAALNDARAAQREAADALQTGKLDAAFEQLQAALEVWDAVHRVTEQGPALLGVTLTSLDPTAGKVERDLTELTATLQQVKDAVGAQDWSTLADLLSHELDGASQRWSDLLTGLGARAEKVSSSRLPVREGNA